jgi:Amt family ammonium transporter
VFAFAVTFVIAKALDASIGLRVTEDEELTGLDTTHHSETAYNS